MRRAALLAVICALVLLSGCECIQKTGFWEFPADVENPKQHLRPGLSFEYPGNWTIATDDEDYDPDRYISVESVGQCLVLIQVLDGEFDEEATADESVTELELIMPSPKVTNFDTYGRYTGEGRRMSGLMYVIKGKIRVFAAADHGGTLMIFEQCYDEDMRRARPGFDLIERTLRWGPDAAAPPSGASGP